MWSRFAGSPAIGTIKRLVCIPLAFMAISANAQLIELAANTDYWDGTIMAVEIPNPTSVNDANGGVPQNLLPCIYILTRKDNGSWGGGYTTSITIEQVAAYHAAANQFYAIGPRTIVSFASIVSKVAGSNSGTNASEPSVAARFFGAFLNAPYNTDEYKFGKFRLHIRVNPGSGFVSAIVHEFIITPRGYAELINNNEGGPIGGGGGIGPDDLNDQPINQTGFWEGIFEGLFIPDPENVNTLRDTVLQFGTWGPFGIISAIKGRFDEYASVDQLDYSFVIDLPMAGPTEFDLTPYSTFIKISRTVMAMTLWFAFVWLLWKRIYQKV